MEEEKSERYETLKDYITAHPEVMLSTGQFELLIHAGLYCNKESIFDNGLYCYRGNDLTSTASYSQPVTEKDMAKIARGKQTDIEKQLENYSHRGSDGVYLLKLPMKYFVRVENGEVVSQAFMNYKYDAFLQETSMPNEYNGKVEILDPRLIVGVYSSSDGSFETNPVFEQDISPEFDAELTERKLEAERSFEERQNTPPPPLPETNIVNDVFL